MAWPEASRPGRLGRCEGARPAEPGSGGNRGGIGADGRAAQLLGRVRRRPVLTVGESRAFLDRGGIIRFRLDGQRVRFEMAPHAAEMAGRRISSRLFGVAEIVEH